MHLPGHKPFRPILGKTFFQGPAEIPDSKQFFFKKNRRVPKKDDLRVEENGLNFEKLSECKDTRAGLIWGFMNAPLPLRKDHGSLKTEHKLRVLLHYTTQNS